MPKKQPGNRRRRTRRVSQQGTQTVEIVSSTGARRRTLDQRCIDNSLRAVQRALQRSGTVHPLISLVPDTNVVRTAGTQRIVYVHQYCGGIPVYEAVVTVTLGRDARVASMTGTLHRLSQPAIAAANVSPVEVVAAALEHVKAVKKSAHAVEAKHAPKLLTRIPLPAEPTLVEHRVCRAPAMLHLTWISTRGRMRLAWRVLLKLRHEKNFELLVSATDGPEILQCSLASLCVGASAPVLDPYGILPASPISMPRALADYPADPSNAPDGFPWDWVDDTQTSGLNVRAGTSGQCKPVRGATADGIVEFAAGTESDQRVLHAFYWCNFLHDFFYLYGFDESAGNYQKQGMQPGGRSGDPVWALVMQKADQDLAWISPVPDGTSPRIVLHAHSQTSRHAAFDPDVLIHEYTHAVTERLCGGRLSWSTMSTPQGLALAEGYSDFFAVSLRLYDAPALTTTAFAAYVANDTNTGLRRQAYGQGFTGTFAELGTPGFRTPYEAGQVWAACLLAVIDALGTLTSDRRRGARMTWRIVIDSVRRLRVGSGHPTWLDARDALLASLDHVSHTGDFANTTKASLGGEVMATFARFGMGAGARSPNASFAGLIAGF